MATKKKDEWGASMLRVYTKANCAFTPMVLHALDELGLEYEEKNVADPGVVDELIALGGKPQTPFLLDAATGEGMYESSEIIGYLITHYGTKEGMM